MSGLSPFKRVLASGESQNLSARGKLVVLVECKDTLHVTTIQNQVEGQAGEQYSVDMQRREKYYSPNEFDQVRLFNNTPNEQTVELLIGFGNYVQPPPDNPRGDIFGGPSILTLAAAGTKVLDFVKLRRDVRIKAKETNTLPVFLDGTQADAAAFKGLGLNAGEVYAPRARGELWGSSGDGAQKIYLIEETFVEGPPPPAPVGTDLILTAQQVGGACPCCPCGAFPNIGFSQAPFNAHGALAPDILFGNTVYTVQWSGATNELQLTLAGLLPQNTFTNLEIVELGLNFTSAAATYVQSGVPVDLTQWTWPAAVSPFVNAGVYTLRFT